MVKKASEIKQEALKTEKTLKNSKKNGKSNKILTYLLIFVTFLLIVVSGTFFVNSVYGKTLFDKNMTRRTCDFLSIEGLPIVARCSDGTYWDVLPYQDGN